EDTLQLWAGTKVGYTPTLLVGYGGLWGENYWYAKTNVWEDQRLMTFVPRRIVDARARRRTLAPDDEWNHFNIARIARNLSDRGGGRRSTSRFPGTMWPDARAERRRMIEC